MLTNHWWTTLDFHAKCVCFFYVSAELLWWTLQCRGCWWSIVFTAHCGYSGPGYCFYCFQQDRWYIYKTRHELVTITKILISPLYAQKGIFPNKIILVHNLSTLGFLPLDLKMFSEQIRIISLPHSVPQQTKAQSEEVTSPNPSSCPVAELGIEPRSLTFKDTEQSTWPQCQNLVNRVGSRRGLRQIHGGHIHW